MMKKKTKKFVLKKRPRVEPKDEVEALKQDLGTYSAIDIVASSEGGQIIIENLLKDIISTIDSLTVKYKTEPASLIHLCADLKVHLDLLRVLTRSKGQKDVVNDLLKDALKE